METGSHELSILNYATVCLHPCVSLNNEKICREFSEHKITVCEKTAGLRNGNSSDLNSACLKELVPVEIFQFSDMHYETEQCRDSTDGLNAIRYQWRTLGGGGRRGRKPPNNFYCSLSFEKWKHQKVFISRSGTIACYVVQFIYIYNITRLRIWA